MSITNDAERVVEQLAGQALLSCRRILYRDTDGIWGELRHDGARFVGFASIGGVASREHAISAVRSRLDPAIAAYADARVQAALDRIESAQRQLDNACQELCAIIGGLQQYKRVSNLHRKVELAWHRLNEWARHHRGTLQLDESGRREFARRTGRPEPAP